MIVSIEKMVDFQCKKLMLQGATQKAPGWIDAGLMPLPVHTPVNICAFEETF